MGLTPAPKMRATTLFAGLAAVAPWCGHCKSLAPHYEEAATILKKDNIPIAKVDCTVETELCSAQRVNGYPTLKVFRNGVPADYSGTRKTDGIVSYMKKQSLPAVSDVTAENHDEGGRQGRPDCLRRRL